MRFTTLGLLLLMLFSAEAFSQSSIAGFKRRGNEYFELAQYRSALHYYRQGGLESSKDKTIRLRIGICLYETNDVDGAIRMFQPLINEGKTHEDVFLYTGKSYQAKNQYAEAIGLYKKFLQNCKQDHPQRAWAQDEIIRCANGSRLKFGDELAYVENAGDVLNTPYKEFGVRTSPTTIDRIYFNSDKQDPAQAKSATGNVDIYGTTLINGQWSILTSLPSHINSPGYDEVCGFSANGQVLYYLTTSGKQFAILTDTFSSDVSQTYKGVFPGPYKSNNGGTDLIFFNDTICLFASDMAGGYGGYDLYISIFRNDAWTPPTNLGPAINSFYNERFPFLTRDGLTLYFSSDGLESIGGYDVFSSTFDPGSNTWSHAKNPGLPINSSLDDMYMVLSPDGVTAYLTSNRKEGYGDEDIYRVFFKQPLIAHQQISPVPTFYHWLLLKGTDSTIAGESPEAPTEVKEYFISHLFLDENAEILTPQNNKKLDLLSNLLMIYPKIKVEFSCFELPSEQRTFNLYFSIKKTQEAAEYLVNKGIMRNRFLLKGYGASFPLVSKPPANMQSPVYQKLNQRLEITLHYFEEEPVIIHMENIQVPENLLDPKGVKFSSLRHQLYYSVQIASVSQILQNPNLESIDELFIEVDNATGNYLYLAGMLPTYEEATQMEEKLVNLGFLEASIIPYINGIRISEKNAIEWVNQYPDLLHYLEENGK